MHAESGTTPEMDNNIYDQDECSSSPEVSQSDNDMEENTLNDDPVEHL